MYYAQQAEWETPPATVFTVHNLMFQGLFSLGEVQSLGVRPELLTPDGIEFYGQASLIKAGLQLADRLTTVSPAMPKRSDTPSLATGSTE